MILMHVTLGVPVEAGDVVVCRDDETWVVADPIGREPHKPGSTGRVYVEEPHKNDTWTREFFPSVFDMQWTDES